MARLCWNAKLRNYAIVAEVIVVRDHAKIKDMAMVAWHAGIGGSNVVSGS
jgi:hypothetical protein